MTQSHSVDHNIDRTDCRLIVGSYRVLFLLTSLWGTLWFVIYHFYYELAGDIESYPFYHIYRPIQFLDYILLPRSLLEIDQIYVHYGSVYYICVTLCDVCLSASGIIAICLTLINIIKRDKSTLFTSSNKVVCASSVIFLGSVIWRPAYFSGSIIDNVADVFGIYFLRESILQSFGYYNAAIVIANLIVSMRSR